MVGGSGGGGNCWYVLVKREKQFFTNAHFFDMLENVHFQNMFMYTGKFNGYHRSTQNISIYHKTLQTALNYIFGLHIL